MPLSRRSERGADRELWERTLAPVAARELDADPGPEITAADSQCTHLSFMEWIDGGHLAAWQARRAQQTQQGTTVANPGNPDRGEPSDRNQPGG